jgi:acetylornithine deacetylase/succinyl-diaminopimelate desuccinylase-like protein
MTQFMVAMELLDRAGFEPTFNIKVIIDAEEELGSPNLPEAVETNRELLAADMLLIFDGPPHPSNKPTVSVLGHAVSYRLRSSHTDRRFHNTAATTETSYRILHFT